MSEQFRNAAQTRLNGAIDDSQTTLTVFNSTGFPTSGDFRIRLNNEIMKVTGVAGNVWTVERAAEEVGGTAVATPHPDKVVVKFVLTAASIALAGGGGGGPTFDAASNLFIGGGGVSATRDTVNELGCDNIGIGGQSFDDGTPQPALDAVTDGNTNIGIGCSTLMVLTTGSGNNAIGESCMIALTTGSNNHCISNYGFFNLTTGSFNCGIGADAIGLVTGSHNTFLGERTDTTKSNVEAGIAIGWRAVVANDNQCVIGSNLNNVDSGHRSPGVCIIWSGAAAPADADLVASQGSLYWDFTPSASALKVKGKSSDGSVFTQTLGSGGAGTVQLARVVLTNAQILALPTTPVQLVAAPGAGKVIVPISAHLYMNWTADYTNIAGTCTLLIWDAIQNIQILGNLDEADSVAKVSFLLAEGASTSSFMTPGYTSTDAFHDGRGFSGNDFAENNAYMLLAKNAASGNFTGGNAANTLVVNVLYAVLDL